MYPDVGLTKLALAEFYERIGEHALPHLRDRPLTLVRCDKGLDGGCAYMRHHRAWGPEPLQRTTIQEKTKIGEYLYVDSVAAIVALVQMDVLEIHTWNSTVEAVEHPNRIVIDLDPGPDVPWARVVEAAHLVRDRLAALELESFAKTTGGKGLHVVVPLAPVHRWDECFAFARAFARYLTHEDPRTFTISLPRDERRDRILVDYLRNNRTNTSVAAFSTRARPGAPVSVPVAWKELVPALRPQSLTVETLEARLAKKRDPWARYWTLSQQIPAAARRSGAG